MLIFIIILCAILVVVFFMEPRIFLALFHRIAYPKLSNRPTFADKQQHFPESSLLEKSWVDIRDEFQSVSKDRTLPKFHHVDKLNGKISFDHGPAWRTVILKAYDGWFKGNSELFPVTCKLLGSMKDVSTIMFSVLEPGTVIPPHQGKLSGIFRYHLPLQVPKAKDCFMTIDNEKYHWVEGEGVLFDDTHLHAVTNATDGYRVILFLDIKKRNYRAFEIINDLLLKIVMISPLFKRGVKGGSIHIS